MYPLFQGRVSLGRIERFLLADEIDPNAVSNDFDKGKPHLTSTEPMEPLYTSTYIIEHDTHLLDSMLSFVVVFLFSQR